MGGWREVRVEGRTGWEWTDRQRHGRPQQERVWGVSSCREGACRLLRLLLAVSGWVLSSSGTMAIGLTCCCWMFVLVCRAFRFAVGSGCCTAGMRVSGRAFGRSVSSTRWSFGRGISAAGGPFGRCITSTTRTMSISISTTWSFGAGIAFFGTGLVVFALLLLGLFLLVFRLLRLRFVFGVFSLFRFLVFRGSGRFFLLGLSRWWVGGGRSAVRHRERVIEAWVA